ncbi:MAG: hypothetical protein WBA77_21385, partial [Microcoleaceae cyanobacterium]
LAFKLLIYLGSSAWVGVVLSSSAFTNVYAFTWIVNPLSKVFFLVFSIPMWVRVSDLFILKLIIYVSDGTTYI